MSFNKEAHFGAISHLIKTRRMQTDLAQIDLSIELGYRNGQFISNVERGLCSVPLKKLSLVSKILGITHDELRSALHADYESDITYWLENGDTNDESLSVHQGTEDCRFATGQTLPA